MKQQRQIQQQATFAPTLSFMPVQGALLQRKCACGGTPGPTGECAACRQQREAATLQRAASHSSVINRVPSVVHEVLRSSSQPLDPATRAFMEPRFGHDFSQVRVHTSEKAEQSASAVSANAYTVGHHIVFGKDQFVPHLDIGRTLIAHELTHVMQQGDHPSSGQIEIGSSNSPYELEAERVAEQLVHAPTLGQPQLMKETTPMLRAKPNQKTPAKPKIPKICGRPSRKVAGNFITKVNLDVGAHTLTIEWNDPNNIPPQSSGTHNISPGAGLCCVDCNDEKVSQTSDTLCTPKGGSWPVTSTGCALGGHPTAKNPTYFQRGGIAIHSGNTSNPPQSHGCSRTSVEISQLIHDNVIAGQTQIASSGTWSSTTCYLKEASQILSNRNKVCDGNKLKSKDQGKKAKGSQSNDKTETPPSTPVTEALPTENDVAMLPDEFVQGVEEQAVTSADGPGPNNEPPSHESLDEMLSSAAIEEGESQEEIA